MTTDIEKAVKSQRNNACLIHKWKTVSPECIQKTQFDHNSNKTSEFLTRP